MLILSLLLVSPLLGYSTYLLLQEFHDPLEGFHDAFRVKFHQTDPAGTSSSVDLIQLNGAQPTLKSLSPRARVGLVVGALFFVAIFMQSPIKGLALGSLSAFAYFKWRSKLKDRVSQSHRLLIETEFPAFAEIYTILVVAGESPSLALIRIAETFNGKFGELLRTASVEIRNGAGLHNALEGLSQRADSRVIRRFVDALIVAIERGTPLADALHRQVEDARKHRQTEITKLAGKAEIALMVPVVFLILPVSVLFALWPSYLALGQNMF
jgi:tight adherence protein C